MAVIGFTTLDEADTYASSILTTTWDTFDSTQKEKALGSAYNLLLSYSNQYNYSTITDILKNVQAELAIYLLQNKDSQAIQNIQMGITSKTVGNTSETYATSSGGSFQRIPDYIFQMLSSLSINGFTVDITKDLNTI